MDHPGRYLEIVFVGKRIVSFVDAVGKQAGDKLGLLAVEADRGRLVKFRRLFLFKFPEKQSVYVIFQLCVETVVLSGSGRSALSIHQRTG